MTNDKLMIIGAGGHGRVCADIATLTGYREVAFLDDGMPDGVAVKGTVADAPQYFEKYDFFVAIGNAKARARILASLAEQSAALATLVHPKAAVARDTVLGKGVAVMAGAVVNSGARLGDGVIVNTCASVDHDCTLGACVHVAVGAHLCGTVAVGDSTWIGAGATVINNITITGGCTIGAGAVVVKNITEVGTYFGVPAKKIQ